MFVSGMALGWLCLRRFQEHFLQTKMNPLFGKSKSNTLHFETNLFKKMG